MNFLRSVLGVPLLLCAFIPASTHADEIDPMGKVGQWAQDISELTGRRLNVSGYINAHYMNHDGMPVFTDKNLNKSLFQMRELSLFADMVITDNLLFSTELEVSYDLSSKSTSGRKDRLEALLNYYYLDYDISSSFGWDTDKYGELGLRGGRILVPFLAYNENKPNFKQNLMSQPFTAWQIAPVNTVPDHATQFGWTDTGVQANYHYIFGTTGILDAKLAVINGLSSDEEVFDHDTVQLDPPGAMNPTVRPRSGMGEGHSEWDDFKDNNDNKAFVAKLSFVPFALPIDVGVSWYKGKWDNNDDKDLTMYGVHMSYTKKDWSIKGEYAIADVEQEAGINIVTEPGPAAVNTSTGDYHMKAWYLEGAYIPFRYGVGNKHYLKLIARYDDVDTNDKATFTPFDRSRVTLGAEWEFLNNVRLRYETQRSTIDSFDLAPAPYVAAGGKEHIYMNMISLIAEF